MNNNPFTVCIFAGSRSGKDKQVEIEAFKLGRSLAISNIKVIFGGGGSGIMNAIAQGVEKGGGDIIGIMPEFLIMKEKLNRNLSELITTKNMHERKSTMYNKSSAFVIMPGGLGTLEEASEVLAWKQLKIHEKPIIFMDINEFWAPLFRLLKHFSRNDFLDDEILGAFKIARNTQDALSILLDSRRKAS
ncbi:MAG: TIGR00730 family Rossman fold protein [Paracoccaceae bacterium]